MPNSGFSPLIWSEHGSWERNLLTFQISPKCFFLSCGLFIYTPESTTIIMLPPDSEISHVLEREAVSAFSRVVKIAVLQCGALKKKTIWTTWNQSRKTKQNSLQGLWAVKERPSNSVCVHEAENLSQSSFFFFNENTKQEMVLISELKKERMWGNYKLSQQNICCLYQMYLYWRFEWSEEPSVCLCFVDVREGYDGVSSSMVVICLCYDSHCKQGPTLGLVRK